MMQDKFYGCFYGGVVGDCLGTTYEFSSPPIYYHNAIVGSGPFNLTKGFYTDDTIMVLCLIESLLKNGNSQFDQLDTYIKWYDDGYLSPTGDCFDIGGQTRNAIEYYQSNCELVEYDEYSAGNGSLMRSSANILYFLNLFDKPEYDIEVTKTIVTTHNNKTCVDIGLRFSKLCSEFILKSCDKKSKINEYKIDHKLSNYPSGYILDSYVLALDANLLYDNFDDMMRYVIEKGYDTDTNASIAGMLYGSIHGMSKIPERHLNELYNPKLLNDLVDGLYEHVRIK